MVRRLVGVAVVLAVLSVGCAGGSSGGDAGAGSSSADPGGLSSESSPGSGSAGSGAPGESVTTTTEAVAALSDFPLNDQERACVVERAGVPADELTAVPADELRLVVEDCVQLETFGPALTAGLAEDFPGAYSDDELACIEEAYAALSTEDFSALTAAGLAPGDGAVAAAGAAVLGDMFASCGTVPPEEL